MAYENIIVERDGHVATVRINRPKALNALNTDTLRELHKAFSELQHDKDVYAVILTGEGEKSFVAGADISQMGEMNTMQARKFSDLGHTVLQQIEDMHCPVIAAVNGFALGGGTEIALACDMIYASEKAKFGQPEVKLGLIPGFGGCERLSRLIGLGRAREMIYTGEVYSAQQAKDFGLALEVFAPDQLMAEVKKIAEAVAARAPIAIQQAKRAINRGHDADIHVANELEKHCFATLFGTADAKEGMKAFVEKRQAEFKGE